MSKINLDEFEDKPVGGRIYSSDLPRVQPEDTGRTEGTILEGGSLGLKRPVDDSFLYHYDLQRLKHPYKDYVGQVAASTGRPAKILHNNLQTKYHQYILGKIPSHVKKPTLMPPTGKLQQDYKRLAPYSRVDMVDDYLDGKPSSLDDSKYIYMNGEVMKKGESHRYTNVDRLNKFQSQLIPLNSRVLRSLLSQSLVQRMTRYSRFLLGHEELSLWMFH